MTRHIEAAKRVLTIEIDALRTLSDGLTADFDAVIERLRNLQGRLVLVGVGKSGHVARKISATLASTGTKSIYVHPTEASHGDMGMIGAEDAVLALSRSGETNELSDVIAYCRRFDIPLIAMTARPESTLGQAADYVLALPAAPEACAETQAPTTSTTLQIALGDALAVALLEAKGFTASDFHTFHPRGALGTRLQSVKDLMHQGDRLPLAAPDTPIEHTLAIMSGKGFGCAGIVDDGQLVGMITDGDIRRNIANDLTTKTAADIMTKSPKTVAPNELAASALRLMTGGETKIMQLFVVENGRPVGLVHLHDFLRAGLA